jgi:mevalonate pyrophosphate decarboxylase
MTESNQVLVTFECAPNIALIKYWGKSNEELVLPLNGSISITLDHNVMCSKTSLMLIKKKREESNKDVKIQIWLNKVKQEFIDSMNGDLITKKIKTSDAKDELINKKRFLNVLNKVRSNCSLEDPTQYDINICSMNNFPTGLLNNNYFQ